ncbi:hypothetical protein Gocc_1263 [Gaiella occulta]|uniref:Uncharacterized protein n=1 Tax=Gaiella occulta TaxID=1002870 RepID=A0A7M2YZ87_9ACTN|nr:hypothetical protein [Gaiella occulta]RDI75465.1 hypothetical protein Gocc_1263 [Gaiella occulta]
MPALARAYEVADRLLAGPYPGASAARETPRRTAQLEAAGVTLFVDLTEPGELEPYAALLERARHVRRPIADHGAAFARIAQLRAGIPGARRSPETDAQQSLVRGWRRGA